MGRQLPVILHDSDEAAFLAYLQDHGPIRLLEYFAPSPDDLWVDAFSPTRSDHFTYRIWPTTFPWRPVYKTTVQGHYYAANGSTAPLLEYSRAQPDGSAAGRLYWAKTFSGTPEYDVEAFDTWVDDLWRWVRKTATRARSGRHEGVWIFPGARAWLDG